MERAWLILVISLPTGRVAVRMRVWRALKALGCGVLRDGVYLLPNRAGFRQVLLDQAREMVLGGGYAQLLALDSDSRKQ